MLLCLAEAPAKGAIIERVSGPFLLNVIPNLNCPAGKWTNDTTNPTCCQGSTVPGQCVRQGCTYMLCTVRAYHVA